MIWLEKRKVTFINVDQFGKVLFGKKLVIGFNVGVYLIDLGISICLKKRLYRGYSQWWLPKIHLRRKYEGYSHFHSDNLSVLKDLEPRPT